MSDGSIQTKRGLQLDRVVLLGRTFEEYRRYFLFEPDLLIVKRVLDVVCCVECFCVMQRTDRTCRVKRCGRSAGIYVTSLRTVIWLRLRRSYDLLSHLFFLGYSFSYLCLTRSYGHLKGVFIRLRLRRPRVPQ